MKNKRLILLSHTWGILMTLIGYAARLALLCMGVKGQKQGFTRLYKLGKNWGGVTLGTTIIVANNCDSDFVVAHEIGHAIQNTMFGVLFPFVVGIPSLIRCGYYNCIRRNGIEPKRGYYDIWFEAQASQLGIVYVEELDK